MYRVRRRYLAQTFMFAAVLLATGCEPVRKESEVKDTPPVAEDAISRDLPQSRPGFVERKINVDPVLIGIAHSDSILGLRFAPPAAWPPIEPGLFEKAQRIRDSLFVTTDRFVSRPVRMFVDHDRHYYMILATFPNWPVPLDPYTAFLGYGALVRRRVSDLEVSESYFRHGGLDIYQLFISNAVMVNWRLMILREGCLPVQVDYLMPRASYEVASGVIEASIGSFQSL